MRVSSSPSIASLPGCATGQSSHLFPLSHTTKLLMNCASSDHRQRLVTCAAVLLPVPAQLVQTVEVLAAALKGADVRPLSLVCTSVLGQVG